MTERDGVQISPEFFVYNNLITPEPNRDSHTENSILFLAEYCLLFNKLYGCLPFSVPEIDDAIRFHVKDNNTFMAYPEDDYSEEGENPWSHDNYTGVVILSKLAGLNYHKVSPFSIRGWKFRIQPWNLIFWYRMRNDNLMLRALSIINVFKYLYTMTNIHTSGKLLGLMQMEMLGWTTLPKVCLWLSSKTTKYSKWSEIFATYFKFENHPINVLVRKIWT